MEQFRLLHHGEVSLLIVLLLYGLQYTLICFSNVQYSGCFLCT